MRCCIAVSLLMFALMDPNQEGKGRIKDYHRTIEIQISMIHLFFL